MFLKLTKTLTQLTFLLAFTLFIFNVKAQEVERIQAMQALLNDMKVDEALTVLDSNTESLAQSRERLLYYMNRGALLSINEEFEESNKALEQAWILIEDFQNKVGEVALSVLSNPMMVEYEGENAEKLFVNYYKAYNYLRLGEYNKALVEARRMDIRLQEINDLYKNENKYQRDAFIHLVMGLVYDANKEYNDAFIAYRNAYTIYQEDYVEMFGLSAPEQLKYDLIRTADASFMFDEANTYREKFGIDYDFSSEKSMGDVVVFWNNGKGPIKQEASYNFTMVQGAGGFVFADAASGEEFPMGVAASATVMNVLIGGNAMVKMAYPVYHQLGQKYVKASLRNGPFTANFDVAEDVNAVLLQSIQDRKAKEIKDMLTRYVVKQMAGKAVKAGAKKLLGNVPVVGGVASVAVDMAVDAANVATEKADIRNWQSLPHTIYYSRMVLPPGERKINFTAESENGDKYTQDFTVQLKQGTTQFIGVSTLDWHEIPTYTAPSAEDYLNSTPLNLAASNSTVNTLSRGDYLYNDHATGTKVNPIYINVPAETPMYDKANGRNFSLWKKSEKGYRGYVKPDGYTQVELPYFYSVRRHTKSKKGSLLLFRYKTNQYLKTPVESKVGLRIVNKEKVDKNIGAIKGFRLKVDNLIETDLKHTAMPNIALNSSDANYFLDVDFKAFKANNNKWLMIFPTGIVGAYLGYPVGFAKAKINVVVNLKDAQGNQLLNKTYAYKEGKYVSLYNSNKQFMGALNKDNRKKYKEDALEMVMHQFMDDLKKDIEGLNLK